MTDPQPETTIPPIPSEPSVMPSSQAPSTDPTFSQESSATQPENSPNAPRSLLHKKIHPLIGGLLVVVVLGIVGGVYAYSTGWLQNIVLIASEKNKNLESIPYTLNPPHPDIMNSDTTYNTSLTTQASSLPNTPAPSPTPSTYLTIEYSAKTQLFESTLPAVENSQAPSITVYSIGTVVSEQYSGGELIVVELIASGPCKGPGCGLPVRSRYIKTNSQIVYLPHISLGIDDSLEEIATVFQEQLGLPLITDTDTSVRALEYPNQLSSGKTGQVITGGTEFEQALDTNQVRMIFSDSTYGAVYTTKEELSPQTFVFTENESASMVEGMGRICPGKGCFLTNRFYWPRPDGTMLLYSLEKEVEKDSALHSYTSAIRDTCSFDSIVDLAVLPPGVITESQLRPETTINQDGTVYTHSNQEFQLYRDFYAEYSTLEDSPVSYAEFVAAKPLLFYKDPFGRWIRLAKSEFLPPLACEPIIYLYPEATLDVQVQVDDSVRLLETDPPHGLDGWKLTAHPDGTIIDSVTHETHPYLFWEGYRTLLPRNTQGFVVEQERVEMVLRFALTKYGLIDHEIEDFLQAWLPKFTGAAYYFISFYPQETIDQLYPLNVEPAPNTVIRVLMDYQKLSSPISVEPLSLPTTPPTRTGFTLVEWGGLER